MQNKVSLLVRYPCFGFTCSLYITSAQVSHYAHTYRFSHTFHFTRVSRRVAAPAVVSSRGGWERRREDSRGEELCDAVRDVCSDCLLL